MTAPILLIVVCVVLRAVSDSGAARMFLFALSELLRNGACGVVRFGLCCLGVEQS